MKQEERCVTSPPVMTGREGKRHSRWLGLLLFLLGGILSPTLAQDVITFTGGAPDPDHPGVYVIDAGDVAVDVETWMRSYTLTLSRPQGASATHEAIIELKELVSMEGVKVTFAPGETQKTITINTPTYTETCSGNLPAVFGVYYTQYAESEYQLLVVKMNTPAMMEAEPCTFATPLEALQQSITDYSYPHIMKWGGYVLLRFQFTTDVKIQPDSRIVVQVSEADHTGLAYDADDMGLVTTREVELSPLNAGSICDQALVLYRPSDDELLKIHKGEYAWDNTIHDDKGITYPTLEAGPFEVAYPAEDAIKYLFYSRTDLEQAQPFNVEANVYAFRPHFSNVSINKASFKSGETMVITATMDNWQMVKRAWQLKFLESFGVSLDGNSSIEPRRVSFNEATGLVTYYVTAPTVSETRTVGVDFGPMVQTIVTIHNDEYNYDYEREMLLVMPGAEGYFSVTVEPDAAPAVPATAIDFAGMPADGSSIIVETSQYGDFIWREIPLSIKPEPANATDIQNVTYEVINRGGSEAYVYSSEGEQPEFILGQEPGTVTVKATLGSGVSTQRTYYLLASPPQGVHHANTFIAGTIFTQFEFEIMNDMGQVKDDKVTVIYTHANENTRTETLKYSELKRYKNDAGNYCYEVPFYFTEELPEPTSEQIGEPVITAQVFMQMPTGNNQYVDVEATATLAAELRKPSFDDYSFTDAYYNETHPATFTTSVMYLPRKGFTVGYMLPNLNLEKTYSNLSGDPVPSWLTLEEDGDYYYTAHINAQLDLNGEDAYSYLYTMAQRSYIPNEAMERHLTKWCQFHYAVAADHLVYQVNGENVTGDLTFGNTQNIQTILNTIQTEGFYQDTYETIEEYLFPESKYNNIYYDGVLNPKADIDLAVDPLNLPSAYFCVDDKSFDDGANVTLSCEGDTIQTLTGYKGSFFFQPPCDGRTYNIDVYFPAYDKTYNTTLVSHDLQNLYHVDLRVNNHNTLSPLILKHFEGGEAVNLTFNQTQDANSYFPINTMNGIVRIENLSNWYLTGSYYGNFRLSLDGYLRKLKSDIKPELVLLDYGRYIPAVASRLTYDPYNDINAHSWWGGTGWHFYDHKVLDMQSLRNSNTQVTVVNGQGEPITNATINYACVDASMTNQGSQGSATYDNTLGCYPIQTDAGQFAQLIEVVPAPGSGYEPALTTMYLWNYNPNTLENIGKPRRHTIVLHQDDNQLKSLMLETPKRDGSLKDGIMDATINADNLLMMNNEETLNYSQTADNDEVTKHIYDGKFGAEGWHGTKYAHLTGMLSYQGTLDATQLKLEGFAEQPTLTTTHITTADFPFSQNYCLFDFNLTDQIEDEARLALKNGTTTLAELPTLHNHDIDQAAMDEASNVSLAFDCPKLNEVDDQAVDNGVDMKDMNNAFDRLNFQLPPVLPFTVNIERNGDYFIVRACVEKNFLPSGRIMNTLDQLEKYQYFDEQFQACMDAVNTAKRADDDFFDDIPRWPSAFAGVKAFLSGIGYYNRETNKFEITFLDGGLTLEASAAAQANVSFFIGGFGMSIDAKIAMTMGLINTAAEMGDVSAASTKIDFVFDYQTRLKICAWAYGGIDIWIASATAGVRGGASIDIRDRAYVVKGLAGMETTLQAKMEAYAEAHFLCWSTKKSWDILNVSKTWLTPDNASNPFHSSNAEPMFSFTQQNVTKNYKKLRRRVIADLGTPIISNVNGMARPNYLLGGQSLLFNNLKTATNYNDDRVQIYSDGSKSNLVDTGIDAPMYDFAEAHNNNGLELVAFEQVKETINGSELEAMSENDQIKDVTEKSEIHVAMRQNGGTWTTETVGTYWGSIGCVTPAVAVQDNGKAVVVWQQGVAKFNDEGYRYIDGSLMLSRYDGSSWGEPIEIKRIHRRSVPADYQVSMKEDSILVMMALQQDVNNTMKQSSMVYLSISPDDKVRERYTQVEATKPQMVNVNGANLVGYLKTNESGRDIELSTVNMKGELTGKLSGSLGMDKRVMNDFRLVVEDEAADLEDVALLWTQSDQESTDNGDGTTTVQIKNRVYASKLCSHEKLLYFSTPVEVATMPDDVSLASMDGYLDGLDMKVAYCVTNEQDGGAVMETPVAFTNAIDHKATFNAYEVKNDTLVPITITVANNGFEPIGSIDVTMNGETTSHEVLLMPQETTELTVYSQVDESFDGTIDYDVTAIFIRANSNALKARRRGAKAAAARPRRIQQSGTQVDVRQVDMALKMISKKTDADGVTTIMAEVNNASLLPLDEGISCKVGLYDSPLSTEPVGEEVVVNYADLYDATAKENKVKIVTLTVAQPDKAETLYLRTSPMQGSETLKDVRPTNNVLPVSIVGKVIRGDVNRDGYVTIADVTALVNIILGKDNNQPYKYNHKVADVNEDTSITIADVTNLVNIILGKDSSQKVELITNGDFKSNFDGWVVTNGGSGWLIEDDYCISSYSVCVLSQTVTLSDFNISESNIDSGKVTCTGSVDMLAKWENNGRGSNVCEVTVQMLDANGNELATETVLNDTGVFMDWTTFTKSFQLVSGTRKLKYVVRGQDSKSWDGYYGPRFRKLSMKVAIK